MTGKFSLGSGKKKDRCRLRSVPELSSVSSVVWSVTVEDFIRDVRLDCFLAIATEMIVIIEELNKDVLFTATCKSVIGWTVLQSNASVIHITETTDIQAISFTII